MSWKSPEAQRPSGAEVNIKQFLKDVVLIVVPSFRGGNDTAAANMET